MENKKLIRFVESFILLPIVTVSMPVGNIPNRAPEPVTAPQVVLSQKLNTEPYNLFAFNLALDNKADIEAKRIEEEAKILKLKADAIDTYFSDHNMPLEGKGLKMVQEAEKNDIDWRLIPAISVVETTGGLHTCKNPNAQNNAFGWGSCKIGFKSIDQSIEVIARNLGGNNPKTAQHYDGKTTKEILEKYNPPSIVPGYAKRVMKIMDSIGDENLGEADTQTES